MGSRSTTPKTIARAPDENSLREDALAALARRALTRKELANVLERRIAAWARNAARAGTDEDEVQRVVLRARLSVETVSARMVEVGLVNDATYARSRAGRLAREGRSRRAIAAHLAARGVDEAIVRDEVPVDAEEELRAALVLARKKRLGPFAREADPPQRRAEARGASPRDKALATLARAGFGYSTAERVLRMSPEEAEDRLRGRGAW